ncbi:MAG: ATP-binding protein [Mycoplasmataceae bacterium]|nr:ATP-binding protein [Mycoplasmataceae bacterium]
MEKEKDSRFIKVLTGIRRCGKSTMLIQFINQLKTKFMVDADRIIYMDFNDARLRKKHNWESLIEYIEEKGDKQHTTYVFLDEIQDIPNFEDTIITLFENKEKQFDIYITGSNSAMFSKKNATLFTGRTSELKIFPLSFKEIYENIKKKDETDEQFLQRYLVYGGLGITLDTYYDDKKTIENLKKIIFDTINRDIVFKHKIKKDITLFNNIVTYCFEHIGRNVNSINLEKYLKEQNVGIKTILNYIEWICDSQLLQRIPFYNVKGLKTLKYSSMYYAGDLGILSSVIGFDTHYLRGYRLENLVLLQLLSLGYEVVTGNEKGENTIDFIAISGDEKLYIQVSDQINKENVNREYHILEKAKNVTTKIIITNAMNVPKKDNGVKIIFLLKWLKGETTL